MREFNFTAQEGDASNNFSHALKREQGKAERNEQAHRPTDETAGIGRYLATLKRIQETRDGEPHHEPAQRQQEQQRPEKINPRLRACRETPEDDVDAHMAVVLQGVTGGEQNDGSE